MTAVADLTLADVREHWERAADPANPFADWGFSDLWWRHLGGGRPLRLVVTGEAVLPLYEREPGLLALIGAPDADLLGPIGGPVGALREAGARLLAEDLPAGSAAELGGTLVSATPSPVTDLPASFEELLAQLSANHRAQVRARDRRLGATLRTADARTLERDLETLMTFHRAHFGARSGVFGGARIAFHRELAAHWLERGRLRLRVLEVGGRPVAANYALRAGDAEWYYQAGRDPEWAHASPGSVLQARCVAAAIDDGMRTYRWLRGDEAYKRRWPTRDEPVETVLVDAR